VEELKRMDLSTLVSDARFLVKEIQSSCLDCVIRNCRDCYVYRRISLTIRRWETIKKILRGTLVHKPSKFRCLICGEVFDTRTGKGKMHMTYEHGFSLEGAIRLGKAEAVRR